MSKQQEEEGGPYLPRAYRWMLRFGPWGLAGVGAVLIAFALASHRPEPLVGTLLVLGVACLVAGVVLPRTKQMRVGRDGISADLEDVRKLDRTTIAMVANEAAQKAISDDVPDKDRIVQHLVEQALQTWTGTGVLAGTWWEHIPAYDSEPEKIDRVELTPDGENVNALITRTEPSEQDGRTWLFEGKVRGNLLFGMFYTRTPGVNALSYGTIQLRRDNPEGTVWSGFYVRLEIRSDGDGWSETLEPIPLSWNRVHPRARERPPVRFGDPALT